MDCRSAGKSAWSQLIVRQELFHRPPPVDPTCLCPAALGEARAAGRCGTLARPRVGRARAVLIIMIMVVIIILIITIVIDPIDIILIIMIMIINCNHSNDSIRKTIDDMVAVLVLRAGGSAFTPSPLAAAPRAPPREVAGRSARPSPQAAAC